MPSSPSSPTSLQGSSSFLALMRIGLRMPIATLLLFAALALASLSGCARAVLVPEGSPTRIGPDAKARLYVLEDGEWTLSCNKVEVPEGWYLVPPSFVEEDK